MTTYFADYAWLGGDAVSRRRARSTSKRAGSSRSGPAWRTRHTASGVTIPGLANAHSHAFQRALRGQVQRGGGSFWTWREDMYALATTMTPDRCFELAKGAYAEMLRAGITTVGEFDYLHFSEALIAAAREVGIRLTLLDACYLAGGFDEPPNAAQRGFSDGDAEKWAERVSAIKGAKVGAAIHSVRAVPRDQLDTVVELARGKPLHFHVSEQRAENEACLAAHGLTPVQLLAEHGALGQDSTAVHATHLSDGDDLGETTICMCPTTERDLADGIGHAGPRLALGSDSHAVIDLFEEARAVELNLRLKTERRGHFTAAALLRRRDQPRLPRLGRRRPDRARGPRGPRHARPHLPAAGDRAPRHDARVDRVRRHRRRRHEHDRRMLITNLGTLVTNDPELGTLHDAAIVFEDGKVAVGRHAGRRKRPERDRLDAGGRALIPGFVDSTATWCSRATARRSSRRGWRAARTRRAGSRRPSRPPARRSDEQLKANLDRLVHEALRSGTTTVETKSGYGLTVPDEERALRLAARPGAHVPRRPRRPARGRRRRLHRPRQGRDARRLRAARVLDRRLLRGRRVRRRADPGDPGGREAARASRRGSTRTSSRHGPGVQIAVELGAASADHCTHVTDADIDALANCRAPSPTLLPGAEFSTRAPYPDARRLLDAGVTVALAADCNPGSSYTTNIPFCIAIAVREMFMTPDEAVRAATLGGAKALRRDDIGHLAPGARADAVLLEAPSHLHLAYRPGVPLVNTVWKDGVTGTAARRT